MANLMSIESKVHKLVETANAYSVGLTEKVAEQQENINRAAADMKAALQAGDEQAYNDAKRRWEFFCARLKEMTSSYDAEEALLPESEYLELVKEIKSEVDDATRKAERGMADCAEKMYRFACELKKTYEAGSRVRRYLDHDVMKKENAEPWILGYFPGVGDVINYGDVMVHKELYRKVKGKEEPYLNVMKMIPKVL